MFPCGVMAGVPGWCKIYRDYFEPILMDLVLFQYLYGGFDAQPIHTEFLEDDRAIFRVGVLPSLTFHSKILKKPCNFDRT